MWVLLAGWSTLGRAVDTADWMERGDSCAVALDYACAIQLYEEGAKQLGFGDSSGLYATFQNRLGKVHYDQGHFQQAYAYYQLALAQADSFGVSHEKAEALQGMSHILWRYGDNVKSIQLIVESMALFRDLRDTASVITASHILAGIYVSTGEVDEAKEIYQRALSMAEASRDSLGMASSYEYLGVVYFFKEEYAAAIAAYEQSLQMNLRLGQEIDAGVTYANIGEAYNYLQQYDQALVYFKKSEAVLGAHGFNSGLIFVCYSRGLTHMERDEYALALKYYQRSLALIAETGEAREKPRVLQLMADCYARQGRYQDAYHYHERYAEVHDSLLSVNRSIELLDIMGKYELEEKEKENELLTKENEWKQQELAHQEAVIKQHYFFGAVLFILLLIALVLAVKLYQIKILLTHADRTKNKLFGFVAHDLKAPVANIQMLIDMIKPELSQESEEVQELFEELNNASHSVSLLLNDLLSWSISQQEGFRFTPSALVLKDAAAYCIELFQDQLEYKRLKIDDQLSAETRVWMDDRALLAILRNLLSNAIKFSHAEGVIVFSASSSGGRVTFAMEDHGVGMSQEQVDKILYTQEFVSRRGTANEKGSGLGLNLVKEFVEKSKGKFWIDSKLGEGTKISIRLDAASIQR
ncbi:hypothetical protein BFP72_01280 [Reichenbachiella sp. 5M10]|nr:hypothetical protein BFP72_01280 [Reichenbachiella sp. 5M10]